MDEPLARIRKQINHALEKAGRTGQAVRLIGATKGKSAQTIAEAWRAGLKDFGENYFQDWQEKSRLLRQTLGSAAEGIVWHFIGHLQSNKVKSLVGSMDWIHTVDTVRLAEKISQVSGAKGVRQKILLEVNLAKETSKTGFFPEELPKALHPLSALPHLAIQGLMAIPPAVKDPDLARPYFRQLKSLLDECNQTGVLTEPLTELSMGMSQDFTVAVEEGATMVRIGTALFGKRP